MQNEYNVITLPNDTIKARGECILSLLARPYANV